MYSSSNCRCETIAKTVAYWYLINLDRPGPRSTAEISPKPTIFCSNVLIGGFRVEMGNRAIEAFRGYSVDSINTRHPRLQ